MPEMGSRMGGIEPISLIVIFRTFASFRLAVKCLLTPLRVLRGWIVYSVRASVSCALSVAACCSLAAISCKCSMIA